MKSESWVGFDLDGTIAFYDGWKGPDIIGEPIPSAIAELKDWLASGHKVKIMTARAVYPEAVEAIKAWCQLHIGCELDVTDRKDFNMLYLFDDRAVRMPFNGIKV